MSKKLLIAIFVLSLVALPSTTRAGFFDFFRTNQSAQVKTAVKSDNLVLQVQQALAAQGFYKGNLSGVVGAKTKTAIRSFQRMNKLPATGLLDQTTINAILKSGGGIVGCMDPASINYNSLATIPGSCTFGGGSANVSYPSRICNENTGSWVKVTSPNGGEVYTAGETINVTWQSCNIASGVTARIEFISPFSGVSVQNVFTPNTGSISYTLPASSLFAPSNYGNHYKVGITYPSLSVSEDQSNNNFSIIAGGIGSNCDEEDVVVSIAGDTPEGVQNINQFNVLKFTIENESNCDVRLEDFKLAYMTTDGKPYFDEIQVRDEQNNFLGENDELQTDPNFHLGERIGISFSTPLQINSGDSKDLILRLVNYNQPVFDNTVAYNSYKHKYLLFGFINEDDFDFKWTTPQSLSFGGTLDPYNNGWGKRVRIPVTSLGL